MLFNREVSIKFFKSKLYFNIPCFGIGHYLSNLGTNIAAINENAKIKFVFTNIFVSS